MCKTIKFADLKHQNSFDSSDYFYGLAGTGQPLIKYPKLEFTPENFFALGSPIPMFLTVRGIEHLGTDFKLPNCSSFFNIFHPFDPVAYRLEPLIVSSPILKPVLIPHHKGRKRLHLELREGLTKVEDLRQKMYDQIKNYWSSLTEYAKLPKLAGTLSPSSITSSQEITLNTITESRLQDIPTTSSASRLDQDKTNELLTEIEREQAVLEEIKEEDQNQNEDDESRLKENKIDFGLINKGRRVDYVLQERPIESFNEYLFALASHACYWESEDTLLLIVKEIYDLGEVMDANIELQLTEQQQQQHSWLTQTAVSALNVNLQKTFSYFNFGLPKTFSSVLPTISSTSNTSNSKNMSKPNSNTSSDNKN